MLTNLTARKHWLQGGADQIAKSSRTPNMKMRGKRWVRNTTRVIVRTVARQVLTNERSTEKARNWMKSLQYEPAGVRKKTIKEEQKRTDVLHNSITLLGVLGFGELLLIGSQGCLIEHLQLELNSYLARSLRLSNLWRMFDADDHLSVNLTWLRIKLVLAAPYHSKRKAFAVYSTFGTSPSFTFCTFNKVMSSVTISLFWLALIVFRVSS